MTGNFKLRTVENNIEAKGKWIVREDNIERGKKTFYNMKNYRRLEEKSPKPSYLDFLRPSRKDAYSDNCSMYEHDVSRKLNIEEYFMVERFLRIMKARYNKKQDKLIKVL